MWIFISMRKGNAQLFDSHTQYFYTLVPSNKKSTLVLNYIPDVNYILFDIQSLTVVLSKSFSSS